MGFSFGIHLLQASLLLLHLVQSTLVYLLGKILDGEMSVSASAAMHHSVFLLVFLMQVALYA